MPTGFLFEKIRFLADNEAMETKQKIIHWLPRILSFGYVLFFSLFAFDVFSGPFSWTMILAFAVHLLPSFLLLIAIVVSWKYDLFGFFIFFGFAVGYVFMVGFDRPWSWYAAISGPSAVVGILYLLSWRQRKHH